MSAASVRALVILTDPIFFSQRKSISWTLPPGAGCRRCISSRSSRKVEAS